MEFSKRKGKLIVFSAPSGSGKSTLVKHLLDNVESLSLCVSVTTRKPRNYEEEGVHYQFISEKEFHAMINKDELLEWEEVYQGVFYGTPVSEINRIWRSGKHAIFDIDVAGALSVKKRYQKNVLTVFIDTPSIEELKKRLYSRNTEDEDIIKNRNEKAEIEMKFKNRFDLVLSNNNLEKAKKEALLLVRDFLKKKNTING